MPKGPENVFRMLTKFRKIPLVVNAFLLFLTNEASIQMYASSLDFVPGQNFAGVEKEDEDLHFGRCANRASKRYQSGIDRLRLL
ncbi:hypothetical protein AMTR_s00105p00107030 [Amborella trichopoda]|uniref:Uncharacterized protein n=1 Tax=Amborella trichopoda TaxID=13333 RepID=W1NSH6_AMBTC|nr:hypothetical protein AMTR_s00105p00107030 [Amborella trichopoda]